MKLKYVLFALLSLFWKVQSVSAALQTHRINIVQDTSVTDGCVRIQLKEGNIIFAKIKKQNTVVITYIPCFPAGLVAKTVDLDLVQKITDEKGNLLFSAAVEGNTRSKKIAKIGAVIAVLGGIAGTIGIQLYLIPTYPITFFLLIVMTLLPLLGITAGLDSMRRYWRGRDLNKWYNRIAMVGACWSLLAGLIAVWLLSAFH